MKDSMYPVTNTVKSMFDRNYKQVIRITCNPVTGESFTLDENDIISGSFTIDRYSVTGERIEVGTAVAGELSFKIKNYSNEWANTKFEGCEMYVRIGIADWTQNPTETQINFIPCGYFTVDKPVKNAQILEITALDRMARFDRLVDTSTLPVSYTPRTIVNHVCSQCGVLLANGSDMNGFPNKDYSCAVPKNVAELTYRNLLQCACMLMGVNAFIDWQGQLRLGWYDFSAFTKTAYGNPIIITDGAENRAVKDCTVEIQPYQSGSGDPSPTNVRPISGWTECNITRGVAYHFDKNIFSDATTSIKTKLLNGKPSTTYIAKTNLPLSSGGAANVFVSANSTSPTTGNAGVWQGNDRTFTTDADGIIKVLYRTLNMQSSDSLLNYEYAIIESGTNTTYTVNLSSAGTVYGGTLDVTTGLLTVTHSLLDLGSLTWEVWPNLTSIFRCALPSYIKKVENNIAPNWKCEIYTVREGTAISSTNYSIGQLHQSYLLTRDTRYTDATAYKSAMSGKHLCYELATPQTHQLTPTEITTLLGNNAITCNCGDITLIYYPDINLFENIIDLGDQMWGYGESDSDFRIVYNPNDRLVYVNGTTIRPISYNLLTVWLEAGTYALYGMPTNMPGTSLRIHGNGLDVHDTGYGVEFTVTADASFSLDFCVDGAGYTFNNFQFYPKIYTATNNYPRYDASKRYTHTLQENDITITGVIYDYTNDDNETTRYISGTDDYAIDITDNPFVKHETVQNVIVELATSLVGFTYRPLTMSIKPSPYLYPMDVFEFIASGGKIVIGIVTKCTCGLNAQTHVESNGETNEDNNYASYGSLTNIQAKIVEKARRGMNTIIDERTQYLLALNEMLTNSLGLYVITQTVQGGGTQYYFADAEDLNDATIIYTFNANGFAWTDDWNGGNPVWQYGLTRDGNAVVNMLSAYKISADVISSGVIVSDKGNNYWNLRTGDFYNSIVNKTTVTVQNYILNPLLNIRSGETVPDLWEIIGSDTAEVVNDAGMGMCWHFISTTDKCGARNNAGVLQIDQTASKVYVGANVKVVQSGHYSNLGYKVRAQLTVQYSDNTVVTLYSAAYVDRLNTAQKVTFEFEPNSSKTIKFLDAGFYNTYISTQETTQETYYADMWCSLVNVSDSDSFTINATPTGYQTSTIDYVADTEVGHVLMNEEKAEFVGTTIKGSEIVFAPTANSAVTAKESQLGSNGGVIFEGDGDFTVETATVGITGTGTSSGTQEVQIVGKDGEGNTKNVILMNDTGMWLFFYGNSHSMNISMTDGNGLRIEIDGTGYSNLGWVNDGNGHVVLGR